MEFYKVIRLRRSIRAYKDKEIPEEVLLRILEAARLAPSAKNRQPWKFIVVRDENLRDKLAKAACYQNFVKEAPVVIVAVATEPTYIMTNGVPAYAVDLAIATEHIALAATNEGLGTCWIGAYHEDKVKEILQIPQKYKVVALLPLGYPKEDPEPTWRKSIEEIVEYR